MRNVYNVQYEADAPGAPSLERMMRPIFPIMMLRKKTSIESAVEGRTAGQLARQATGYDL
jgi:hypothetical protein